MSALASFVLDCARSGRWVRGLMALQHHLAHSSPTFDVREARVALAEVTAPHSWSAALPLVQPADALTSTAEVCRTIDVIARHPRLCVEHYEASMETLLKSIGGAAQQEQGGEESAQRGASPLVADPKSKSTFVTAATPAAATNGSAARIQRQVFLSATQWCGWETAARLLASLPTPPPRDCADRVQALRTLRRCLLHDLGPFAAWSNGEAAKEMGSATSFSNHNRKALQHQGPSSGGSSSSPDITPSGESVRQQLLSLYRSNAYAHRQGYSAREQRELAALREKKRHTIVHRALAAEAELARQATASPRPSVLAVCAALRRSTRLQPSSDAAHKVDGVEHNYWPSHEPSFDTVVSMTTFARLTPDIALVYARGVGLRAPQQWEAALANLQRAEVRNAALHAQIKLWLMSRANWQAALTQLTGGQDEQQQRKWLVEANEKGKTTAQVSLSEQQQLDLVQRTALPAYLLLRLFPQQSRPWYRLLQPHQHVAMSDEVSVSRLIARALARGVRVDEIQLSTAGRQWAAQGRWESALFLYYRFPLPEFQKYATRSLLKARPALPHVQLNGAQVSTNSKHESPKRIKKHSRRAGGTECIARCSSKAEMRHEDAESLSFALRALYLLVPPRGIQYNEDSPPRPSPPLEVFPACLLIQTTEDWREALQAFRACVRTGTRCTPQLLSGLMHQEDMPASKLEQVLSSYPAAVNSGVRRRAMEKFGVKMR